MIQTAMAKRVPLRLALAVIGLTGLVFLVYSGSLFGDFVFDDRPVIIDNDKIKSFRYLPEFFTHGVWYSTKIQLADTYRPLFLVFLMLNYKLWGLNPFGFHLTNILFHAANSVLVFFLVRRMLQEEVLIPFIGASIFAVHPVNTESVSWICGLTDPLAVFFLLLSFLCYLKYKESGKAGSLALSAVLYLFAIMSKEAVLLFPATIAAYDYIEEKRIYFRRLAVYGLAAAVFFTAMFLALGETSKSGTVEVSSAGVLRLLEYAAGYVKLLFIPWPLEYYLTTPEKRVIGTPGAVFSIFALSAMVLYSLKNRLSTFALFWMAAAILPPRLLALSSTAHYAVRYLYLPSVGFATIIASAAALIRYRKVTVVVACLIVAVLGALTFRASLNWKDDNAFYSMTIRSATDYMGGYLGVAKYFERIGRNDKAVEVFKASLDHVPGKDKAFAYEQIALLYGKSGFTSQSIEYFNKLLKLKPMDTAALTGLGNNYMQKGDHEKALHYYGRALAVDGQNFEALYNIALTYERMGDMIKAGDQYKRFISIAPKGIYAGAIEHAESFLKSRGLK
jgi:tetratricopeptide (TPR) repeat protein